MDIDEATLEEFLVFLGRDNDTSCKNDINDIKATIETFSAEN